MDYEQLKAAKRLAEELKFELGTNCSPALIDELRKIISMPYPAQKITPDMIMLELEAIERMSLGQHSPEDSILMFEAELLLSRKVNAAILEDRCSNVKDCLEALNHGVNVENERW